MPTLAELIQEARGDDSYDTVAKRGNLSSSQLHNYALGKNSLFPEPETISRLARGLRVSEARVVLAAAEGLGFRLNVDEPHTLVRLLPEGAADLPPWCLEMIVTLVRQLVAHVEATPALGDEALAELAQTTRARVDAHQSDHSGTRSAP